MPKDTHSTLPADAELVLPERVTVALAELAGARRVRQCVHAARRYS
jgi:hypothetical protein